MNTIEKDMKKSLWRQRIGYGSSDFACNLIWQVISLYLLYFYTDVMHLNAAAVSVMFLVTKVFDGFTDLAVGFLIDRTNTKWGKSRPWIFAGAIPFAITAVLAFSVPDISQKGMLIYAYVTYMLLSLAYTVVNIPMASILPALTADSRERTNLATSRVFFSYIGSTVVSAFALKLVDQLGGGNEAVGFRIVMMIFGALGCLVFFFCFFNTKERVRINEEKVSIKASLNCLIHNKPWLLFAANIIWFFGGYVIQAGAIIFYFTYNLNNKELSSVAATITTLIPVVTNLCVPFLSRLTTKRNLMIAGSVLHGAGLIIIFIGGSFVPLVLVGVVIGALGYGLKGSMHFAIQPDPVDYGEWKSGVNISGTLSAVNGFIGKVGMAVASSVAAAMLAASGYVANAPVQQASALHAISAMYIWIPIATNVLTIVTFLFYDLDKKLPEINKELEARKAGK
ncbi:glycoside-pentoside-hexuronide (GPH):cation symporter [Lacrimispora sp.]|uniref:glycoside-pentoside-hexuronide (GPH):cation symporter n=1 Tax=Lacrimispora sp. TaxID=2719234 RepID=UPI003993F2CF